MINVIIPGFATEVSLFEDFLKLCPETIFIETPNYLYSDVENQLTKYIQKDKHKINIFGWSLGSIFALKWTINHKEFVSSLFLTGATARFCEKDDYKNNVKEDKLLQMLRLIKRRPQVVLNDFFNIILDKTKNKKKYFSILMNEIPDNDSLENGLNELLHIDLLNQVSNIETPVYIYQGNEDMITTIKGAEILHSLLPDSALHIYEGGHSSFLENPVKCADTWRKFLCTIA